MGLIDRLRVFAARLFYKANGISFVPPWVKASFFTPTWQALVREGYKGNSAVMACASALAFAFPEPPLMVYREGEEGLEPQLTHPLRKLFRRPNKSMDEATFKAFCIIYASIGGNCYIYRERGVGGPDAVQQLRARAPGEHARAGGVVLRERALPEPGDERMLELGIPDRLRLSFEAFAI